MGSQKEVLDASFYRNLLLEKLVEERAKALQKSWVEGWEAGWKEGRLEAYQEIICDYAKKKFQGLQIGQEVSLIRNLHTLRHLCLELYDFSDAESLQRRARELAKLN